MSTTPQVGPTTTASAAPSPIVVHCVWHSAVDVANWPEFCGEVGRAYCGFRFTPANTVEAMTEALEGSEECQACLSVDLEMYLLAGSRR